MAIKVYSDGSFIEVDSEVELRIVLSVLGKLQTSLPLDPLPLPKSLKLASGGEQAFVSMVTLPRPKKMLESLAHSTEGLWDSDICSQVDVKDNLALAGVITSLYATGRKCGLGPDDILIKTKDLHSRHSRHHYKITPKIRAAYFQHPSASTGGRIMAEPPANGHGSLEEGKRLVEMN